MICYKCGKRLILRGVGEDSNPHLRFHLRNGWGHRICPKRADHKKRTKPSRRVTKSGRVTLSKNAYMHLKAECLQRASGYCEGYMVDKNHPRHALEPPIDPHHIKWRSRGGSDCAENIAIICRELHDEIHGRKVRWSKKERTDERVEDATYEPVAASEVKKLIHADCCGMGCGACHDGLVYV